MTVFVAFYCVECGGEISSYAKGDPMLRQCFDSERICQDCLDDWSETIAQRHTAVRELEDSR